MVSSRDVAKRAGVSQATVSRVLNKPETVARDKFDKVMKAMKELNYRPNSIARSLVSKRTKAIALISGPLHNPFFVETTTSIVNYANDKGYKTMVFFEDNSLDNEALYEAVFSVKVDGIILSSIYLEDPIYQELLSSGIPFVMYNRKHNIGGNYVEIDNIIAGEMATKHLIEYGHKKIAYLGGPLNASTFYGRYSSFSKEMKKHNLFDEKMIYETDTTEESVKEAVLRIMGSKNKPTAILAATDSMAIFAINILNELGYSIPNDISIVGIDNVKLSSHKSFELTTVGYDSVNNIGSIAIEYLLDLIEDESGSIDQSKKITVPPVLYVRESTIKI